MSKSKDNKCKNCQILKMALFNLATQVINMDAIYDDTIKELVERHIKEAQQK